MADEARVPHHAADGTLKHYCSESYCPDLHAERRADAIARTSMHVDLGETPSEGVFCTDCDRVVTDVKQIVIRGDRAVHFNCPAAERHGEISVRSQQPDRAEWDSEAEVKRTAFIAGWQARDQQRLTVTPEAMRAYTEAFDNCPADNDCPCGNTLACKAACEAFLAVLQPNAPAGEDEEKKL